jgi:hypothetical protein
MKVFLSLSFGWLATASALACSCAEPPVVAEEVARSDAVFAGRVMRVAIERRTITAGLPDETEVMVATFSLIAPIKGITPDNTEVVIITALHGSACGFPFKLGSKYLVYASLMRGALETSSCRRTCSFDVTGQNEAEEARQLARPR